MSNSILLLQEKLEKFVPPQTASVLADWIVEENVKIKITRIRRSKTGDYRPPQNGHGHRITLNCDLNKYEFLVTLIHEFAHLKTTKRYSPKELKLGEVMPHGKEWKHEFKSLMNQFIYSGIFPPEVNEALIGYMQNPAASSCSDLPLQRAFRKYDSGEKIIIHLEDLSSGAVFKIRDGRTFRILKKMRKHFRCEELITKRIFSVNAIAEVEVIDQVTTTV